MKAAAIVDIASHQPREAWPETVQQSAAPHRRAVAVLTETESPRLGGSR